MRSVVLGLAALLAAGIVGGVTADAQSARKGVPVGEMKKVQAFQSEFNQAVDRLLEQGRNAGASAVSPRAFIVSTRAFKLGGKKVIVDTKAIVFKEQKATMTMRELEGLKGKVNARLAAMLKKGNLTEMDRRLIEENTLDGLSRKLRR
jgi:hypothetical protein